MNEYLDLLLRTQLFAGVGKEELSSMLACLDARLVHVRKNNAVFTEGDPAQKVGIVLQGSVQIVRDDYYGSRSVMNVAEPGDMFAEAFSCAGLDTLPVSVIALQDSAVALFDCRRVLTVCSSACSFHSRLIANLMMILARKNILLSEKIQVMSKKTTREKLMAYLLDQAKKRGSSEFIIPYDRQALADHLGVERSAMSAEIGKMKREGLLDTRGSWFFIYPA